MTPKRIRPILPANYVLTNAIKKAHSGAKRNFSVPRGPTRIALDRRPAKVKAKVKITLAKIGDVHD